MNSMESAASRMVAAFRDATQTPKQKTKTNEPFKELNYGRQEIQGGVTTGGVNVNTEGSGT
tara:strand:+ start:2131 stop:2313 length:183 start_codon:yes stop_codon:yes gene_type:complete